MLDYHELHKRIRRQWGSANKCEICGRDSPFPGEVKSFEWMNVDHKYEFNKKKWMQACVSCHRIYDRDHNLYYEKRSKDGISTE